MSVFYPAKLDDASFLAAALVWQAETGIANNTAYARAFGKLIEAHTSQGVRIVNGSTVNLGLVENKNDLISNPKTGIALAPALRRACLDKAPFSDEDSEKDLIDIHVSILPDGKYYACGYQGARNLFDLVLTQDASNSFDTIADEIGSLILMGSDEFAIALHTTWLEKEANEKRASDLNNQQLTDLLEEAISNTHEFIQGHLEFFSKNHHRENLLDLLRSLPADSLLHVSDISKLAKAKLNKQQVATIGGVLALSLVGYMYFNGSSKPTTDQATLDKYNNFQSIEEPTVSKPVENTPVYNPTDDRNALEKIINQERKWIETHIRMNGHRPFNHLYQAVSNLPVEAQGYKLEDVTFADPFSIEKNTLDSIVTSQYVRRGNQTINEFLKVFPDANITLDGNIGLVETTFKKSTHERPFEFKSEDLDLESLISRLQIMDREGVITNWALRKAVPPSRPEKYTTTEENLLSRLKVKTDEDETKWLHPFDVYTVTVNFKYSNQLPRLSVVFDDFQTAVISKLHYQIATQTGALEVRIYDL
ncbi:hypothetical protein [Vibrio agarivorans]|uniref:hypothetical protein n=1 Tax=Vibrio agarivorans TaxID=153622 RepID=UPI0025B512F8|nr:hypothetical protein [Vibrio agarivorans]MDN3661082.1 hypothetical protein [Vibrio agarivorans]